MTVRRTIAGLVALAALAIPATASAETLYDQIDPTSPQSYPSQDFEAEFNEYDSTVADDFTVPAGESWSLEAVLARGTNDNEGVGTTARVAVYNDGGLVPGTALSSQTAPATGFPRMLMTLPSPVVLQPGNYWLTVESLMPAGDAESPSQWYWASNNEGEIGDPAVFKNPGDGFGSGCTTYQPVVSGCEPIGLPGAPEAHDMSFLLGGTRTLLGPSQACLDAQAALEKAKEKLAKAESKLADAKGKKAKKKAKAKVKKAKKKVKSAKAAVAAAC
jgi:hypothetical protein